MRLSVAPPRSFRASSRASSGCSGRSTGPPLPWWNSPTIEVAVGPERITPQLVSDPVRRGALEPLRQVWDGIILATIHEEMDVVPTELARLHPYRERVHVSAKLSRYILLTSSSVNTSRLYLGVKIMWKFDSPRLEPMLINCNLPMPLPRRPTRRPRSGQ